MRFGTRIIAALILCTVMFSDSIQAQTAVRLAPKPAIFVSPTGDGFDVHIAAAIVKKEVPATLVTNADYAAYTLKAESSVARLIGRDGAVLWSCPIPQGRDVKGRQAAESIAKHLKHDFFHK